MKKVIFLLLALMLMIPFCYITPQSLDEIIDYHFMNAEQDKFNQLSTIIIEGKIISGGEEIPFKIYHKRDNKIRTELKRGNHTDIIGYNGNSGWKIYESNNIPKPLTDEELEEVRFQADLDGYFFCYREKPHNLELIGKEKVNNKTYFKIKCTRPGNKVIMLYLDTNDYLLKRTEEQIGNKLRIVQIGDFKKVEGIPFPFKFIIDVNGEKTIKKINTIKLNEEVNDSLFEIPNLN